MRREEKKEEEEEADCRDKVPEGLRHAFDLVHENPMLIRRIETFLNKNSLAMKAAVLSQSHVDMMKRTADTLAPPPAMTFGYT